MAGGAFKTEWVNVVDKFTQVLKVPTGMIIECGASGSYTSTFVPCPKDYVELWIKHNTPEKIES